MVRLGDGFKLGLEFESIKARKLADPQMSACSLTQCVQTFRPPKAQENVEKRKKKRQPYMFFFGRFRVGLLFL